MEQHQAAAGEFSKAAEGVEDAEALRILGLLEQHHQQLAQIIKSQANRAHGELGKDASAEAVPVQALTPASVQSNEVPISPPSARDAVLQRNYSPVDQRRQPRQLSSSIASNLATARGIPRSQQQRARKLSPATSPQSAKGESVSQSRVRRGSPDSNRPVASSHGEESAKQQNATRSSMLQQPAEIDGKERTLMKKPEPIIAKITNDDRFQKFYSTFEGLLSMISAPLAFAGLPLTPEDPSQQNPGSTTQAMIHAPTRATTSDSTDITKLFSKAALHAVKDNHGPGFRGVQESFFVVPTSGGSVSYAGILSRAERQVHNHTLDSPTLLLDDKNTTNEEFVDARESPQLGSSPKSPRRSSTTVGQATRKTSYGNKTTEELEMENVSLKQLTDTLSRRLYMWEKSAQNQTSALQASIRNLGGQTMVQMPQLEVMRDGKPGGKSFGKDVLTGPPNSDKDHGRAAELEEQMRTATRELEKYAKENEKLKTVVMRYRERWDKLKEGARVRREGTAGAVQGTEDGGG